jgi:cytochrome c biogenesis protein CcmG/thiol:disulfide interchange protein DsbE
MRPLIVAMTLAAAIGVSACGSGSGAGNPDSRLSEKQATIRAQGNQILDGGTDAFNARLAELKGTPVVVNKWASWCGPCRFEFPQLQTEATKHAKDVAFLGILSDDSVDSGNTFLSELPLPYPSYNDPDQKIAEEIKGRAGFPATAFYDRTGKLVFTRLGPYTSESQLEADIQRYAS